tara:strand:+ start:330 stop:791 length:462 start_codon:yes stop_codon:yes gene_type:complete
MISSNQYQDIEIQQNSDFQNVITFDAAHTILTTMKYAAVIIKDYNHTAFTGPEKSNNQVGVAAANDNWQSGTVSKVHFDVVANRAAKTVTLTLPAEATQYFPDNFEGHWDLVEKDDQANDAWVKHIQGDVIISNGAVQLSFYFTPSISGIGGG